VNPTREISEPSSQSGFRLLDLLDQTVRFECNDPEFTRGFWACFESRRDGVPSEGARHYDLRIFVERADAFEPGPPKYWVVRTDPPFALHTRDDLLVADPAQLAGALNQWVVDRTGRYYVFHAGAVARRDRGVLLPGQPGRGKSTLTAGLARRGFEVLSDEIGAFDMSSRRLVNYPRALLIRPDVWKELALDEVEGHSMNDAARRVSAAELGTVRARGEVALSLVVFPNFQAREPTRLERLGQGPALIALMEASCSQPRFKVVGLDFVISLVRLLPCFHLVYSDLVAAVELVDLAFTEASEASG